MACDFIIVRQESITKRLLLLFSCPIFFLTHSRIKVGYFPHGNMVHLACWPAWHYCCIQAPSPYFYLHIPSRLPINRHSLVTVYHLHLPLITTNHEPFCFHHLSLHFTLNHKSWTSCLLPPMPNNLVLKIKCCSHELNSTLAKRLWNGWKQALASFIYVWITSVKPAFWPCVTPLYRLLSLCISQGIFCFLGLLWNVAVRISGVILNLSKIMTWGSLDSGLSMIPKMMNIKLLLWQGYLFILIEKNKFPSSLV